MGSTPTGGILKYSGLCLRSDQSYSDRFYFCIFTLNLGGVPIGFKESTIFGLWDFMGSSSTGTDRIFKAKLV